MSESISSTYEVRVRAVEAVQRGLSKQDVASVYGGHDDKGSAVIRLAGSSNAKLSASERKRKRHPCHQRNNAYD